MSGIPDLDAILGDDGPAEPDAGCTAGFELLHRYVEVELAGGDAAAELPGLAVHLHRCPACREDYLGLLESVGRFGGLGPGAV